MASAYVVQHAASPRPFGHYSAATVCVLGLNSAMHVTNQSQSRIAFQIVQLLLILAGCDKRNEPGC